jgi:hypothetical protein
MPSLVRFQPCKKTAIFRAKELSVSSSGQWSFMGSQVLCRASLWRIDLTTL